MIEVFNEDRLILNLKRKVHELEDIFEGEQRLYTILCKQLANTNDRSKALQLKMSVTTQNQEKIKPILKELHLQCKKHKSEFERIRKIFLELQVSTTQQWNDKRRKYPTLLNVDLLVPENYATETSLLLATRHDPMHQFYRSTPTNPLSVVFLVCMFLCFVYVQYLEYRTFWCLDKLRTVWITLDR